MRRSALVVLALGLLATAGCVRTSGSDEISWARLDAGRITRGTVATVFMSNDAYGAGDGQRGGTVAFVGRNGSLTFLATGKLDNGRVAMDNNRRISWASETTSYQLDGRAKSRHRRGGVHGMEEDSGILNGRSFQVFNTGATDSGYSTDIFASTGGDAWAHSTVNSTPGQFGIDGSTVLLTNMWPQEFRERILLAVVPGKPAREITRWVTKGRDQGWQISSLSNLFVSRGRAYFLEDMYQAGKNGDPKRQPDGSLSVLRLASVDLHDGTYQTRVIRRWDGRSRATDEQSHVSSAAIESGRAHFYDGRIYFLDGTGQICGAEIETSQLTCADKRISAASRRADSAYIGWNRGQLTIVGNGPRTFVEAYGVRTGRRIASMPLPKLAEFMERHPSRTIFSVAARQW